MATGTQDLKDVTMKKSGETIRFTHGTFIESDLEGRKHKELMLSGVAEHEMFYERMQDGEPVEVSFTTFDDKKREATLKVTSVNRRDDQNGIIELETE